MGYLLRSKEYRVLPAVAESKTGNGHILDSAQAGDLILVRTRGIGFALGRKLTRNRYDHVAVVLNDGETLNIIMPRTVTLPLSTFSKPCNAPLVLRPKWRTTAQRERFIEEMQGFEGRTYNVRRTLLGVSLTALNTWTGIRMQIEKLDESAPKWNCTEAIIVSLMKAIPEFEAVNRIELDYHTLGFATTNDFLRIAKRFPDLLAIQQGS